MMTSESSVGTFKVEDAFNVTGRGLVLAGQLSVGQVASGNYLVFEDGTRWKIQAVNFIKHANNTESFGFLVDTAIVSRQELVHRGIIGASALIFT